MEQGNIGKEEFIRVGTTLYKLVNQPCLNGGYVRKRIVWNNETLRQDYGKHYLAIVPKYDGFCTVPNHVNYRPVVDKFLNLYEPIDHQPQKGDFSHIQSLVRHIFGEQYELGMDYLQLLYLQPIQKLPILLLVSEERNTGKSTFLNFLKALFQNNVTFNTNEDFRSQFNSDWAGKLLIVVDEVLLSRKEDSERLKNLSTTLSYKVEAKGKDRDEIAFFAKFVLCSNNEYLPVIIDAGETRYWVRKIDRLQSDDTEFLQKLKAEIPAFLYHLQHRKLSTKKESRMWFAPFIIMTDYAEVHTAVESMKLGSLDYIPKQLVEDKLVPLLRIILKERNIGRSRMPVFARDGSAFRKIMHRIRLVAPTDMSVLIFGENGTGKEHIAHHLHDKSKRSGKPFVPVDCGSLAKELAPSAFFGHVKGAFTGADSAKKGYFHEAEGGTLFLDEVGNLAPETQQMLLRAIQERRYRPVGDRTDKSFNVRIIAATNENLGKAVNEKRFRQDLLYRLHDFEITVPSLRDCQEDIMPLAEFFREIANNELECKVSGFSSEARKALLTHSWPGNVRELRQKIMGAVLQAQTGLVTKEHLELGETETTSVVGFSLRNDEEDKERIIRALKQANGNRKVAAELLGIGRTTLYSKLEEYGLKYKFQQS